MPYLPGSFRYGVQAYYGIESVLISRCTFDKFRYAGVMLGSSTGSQTVPSQKNMRGIRICDCTFRDIGSDSPGGSNGMLVIGQHVVIQGNYLENITNPSKDNCEGIYVKALYGSIIGNTLRNAGHEEGAITQATSDDQRVTNVQSTNRHALLL